MLVVQLPPNSTHFLQPLDVAVFGTFKHYVEQSLESHAPPLNLQAAIAEHYGHEAVNAGIALHCMDMVLGGPDALRAFCQCAVWPASIKRHVVVPDVLQLSASSVENPHWRSGHLTTSLWEDTERMIVALKNGAPVKFTLDAFKESHQTDYHGAVHTAM